MVLSREQCALGVALLQGRYLEHLTKYQHHYFGLKNDFFPTIAWTHVHTCLGFPDLAPELRAGLCGGDPTGHLLQGPLPLGPCAAGTEPKPSPQMGYTCGVRGRGCCCCWLLRGLGLTQGSA